MKTRQIPLNIQEFHSIREKKYYYVDKTSLIQKLTLSEVEKGETKTANYFLSRPRRFGKSLLVSTLQHLFEGNEPLFKGLAIHPHWDWSKKYGVVRLSFDEGDLSTPEGIEASVLDQLLEVQEKHQLTLNPETPKGAVFKLKNILRLLSQKYNRPAVLLIDEYDRPILDVLHEPEQALANRKYLRDLYGVVKGSSKHITFTLITGLSMFSKMNLFSKVNNLLDISLQEKYATICGYTEKELKTVFIPELKNFDFEEIRRWYDGYNWGGKTTERIFNPHSVLHLFEKKKFDNWWFKDSIPFHVYEFLKKENKTTIDINNFWVDNNFIGSFDIEKIHLETLLFQSGFLTIRDERPAGHTSEYLLDFPNFEVRQSLNIKILEYYLDKKQLPSWFHQNALKITEHLDQQNIEGLQTHLLNLFSHFPHVFHDTAPLRYYEGWYASILLAVFGMMNFQVISEDFSRLGRADMVLITERNIFIIEFKMADQDNAELMAQQAMDQIKEKGYADKYRERGKELYLTSWVFSSKERSVVKILIEKA